VSRNVVFVGIGKIELDLSALQLLLHLVLVDRLERGVVRDGAICECEPPGIRDSFGGLLAVDDFCGLEKFLDLISGQCRLICRLRWPGNDCQGMNSSRYERVSPGYEPSTHKRPRNAPTLRLHGCRDNRFLSASAETIGVKFPFTICERKTTLSHEVRFSPFDGGCT
jgi:hypothetical protein